MNKIENYDEDYNSKYSISKVFIEEFNKIEGRASDLKALLWSLNRYLSLSNEKDIEKLVIKTGNLQFKEVKKLAKVYIKSMEELKEMVVNESNKENKLTKKQENILIAAVELISEKGYEKVSTAEIAKRGG